MTTTVNINREGLAVNLDGGRTLEVYQASDENGEIPATAIVLRRPADGRELGTNRIDSEGRAVFEFALLDDTAASLLCLLVHRFPDLARIYWARADKTRTVGSTLPQPTKREAPGVDSGEE